MEYEIIEAATVKQEFSYPFWWRVLPAKIRKKKEKAYLLEKLPIKIEEIEMFQEHGRRLILPFTEGEIAQMEQKQIEDIFFRIIQREQVKNMVVNDRLKQYIQKEKSFYPFFLLYIEEALQIILRKERMAKKDAHMIIVDNPREEYTVFLLELLDNEVNYLTIVTDRPGYFQEYQTYAYEEMGLLVQVLPVPIVPLVEEGIIIDLNEEDDFMENLWYPKNSTVLQCFFKIQTTRKILAKRKDIQCYNHIFLKQESLRIREELLQVALIGRKSFLEVEELHQLKETLKSLKITIDKLGIKV